LLTLFVRNCTKVELMQEVTDRSITDVDLATSGITDARLAGGNGPPFIKRQVGVANFRVLEHSLTRITGVEGGVIIYLCSGIRRS